MTTATLDQRAEVKPVERDEHGNSEPYDKKHIEDMAAELSARRRRPQEELDADMKSRLDKRRLKAAASYIGRILVWITFWAALIGLAGAWVYTNFDKIVTDYDKYGMDTRNCIAKVGERTITGTRTYAYRYMTVLGYKIYMTPEKEVKQETRLDVAFNGMTILATTEGQPVEKYSISDGVKERPLLNRADSYTFFMDGGKNTAIIPYNGLCK